MVLVLYEKATFEPIRRGSLNQMWGQIMKLDQRHWTLKSGWSSGTQTLTAADVLFVFGGTDVLKQQSLLAEVKALYPQSLLFGCSTSGEIHGSKVYDDSIGVTAVKFEKTKLASASLKLSTTKSSFDAGVELAKKIPHEKLSHVFALSVGLNVNGSDLVKGLIHSLPEGVTLSGGLAGDGGRFNETLILCGDEISNDMVAVIGFYGTHLKVTSASRGGWDPFGPERLVTKSKGNVLFELDGRSALDLYKNYLGPHAESLPGSALLFPLSLRGEHSENRLVRTILAVDEANQSMTFAGDIPEGSVVQLMKANFDRLIDGAVGAAELTRPKKSSDEVPELALLISCVGRKMVLKQRTEEEVEGVQDFFGPKTVLSGFYSYGEISSFEPRGLCELHNQTMTITTLSEREDEVA